MDGESLLRRYCENAGLDFDSTFFFQSSQVALHPGKRITQQYSSRGINGAEYIVRYYPDNDIFFVWYHIRGRDSCSFGVPDDYSVEPGTLRKDIKRIGNTKDKEPVFSFSSKGIHKFLEEIIKGNI